MLLAIDYLEFSILREIFIRSGIKTYFANTSWLIAERILRIIVAMFVIVYVARYLGPEQFGLLSYAVSFVGLFMALTTLGLDEVVIRELVKSPENQNELLGSAFWLKVGGTFLMWASIAIIIPFTQNEFSSNILIAIVAFAAVFQAFNVIDFHYQSKVKSRYVVHAQFFQLVVSSSTKLAFITVNAPLVWFAWIYILDAIVLSIGLIFVYRHNVGMILGKWKWEYQVAKKLMQSSWPLILSSLVISIYMKIDQVMIKDMLGDKEVGLYSAAVKLSEAWYFIPLVITASLFPAIINSKQNNETIYYQRLQQLYDFLVWIAIIVALPTTFLAPWIIKVLYGEEYALTAEVLCIYIWAGVFVFLGVASGKWLLCENLQKLSFYRSFWGMLVNILLNLLWIPKYGINGAAMATVVSQSFVSYFFDLFNAKTRKTFWMKTDSIFIFRRIYHMIRAV